MQVDQTRSDKFSTYIYDFLAIRCRKIFSYLSDSSIYKSDIPGSRNPLGWIKHIAALQD